MLTREDDIIKFDLNRCVQCRTCLAVCSQGALKETLRDDGLWELTHNAKKCNKCFKCISLCPAPKLPKLKVLQNDLAKVLHLNLVHARESEVRKKSSSGGAARILARTTLEAGITDAVDSVAKTTEYPWAKGKLWKQPMDISELANSMYLPILVNKYLNTVGNEKTILL